MRTPQISALAGFLFSLCFSVPALRAADAPPLSPGDCLSGDCHPAPESGLSVHAPYREGRCRSCHLPGESFDKQNHSSRSFLAPGSVDGGCGSCHRDVLRRAEAPFGHPPASEYDCPACHAPHASPRPALLRESYSTGKTAVYDRSRYALCWNCHDSALGTDKFTVGATGFRNGRRNSHYSHLRKRSVMDCPACHDPHGSGQPFMVRKRPPGSEGWWTGTMAFEKNAKGGRCLGGCHRDISYRR